MSLGRVETASEPAIRPIKFLVVSLNFHPEEISTGKYATELAEHVAAAGMDVRVIASPPYYPQWRIWPGYQAWKYSVERHAGMTIYRCPLWVPRGVRPVTRLLHLSSFAVSSVPALVRQLRWRPDWIFVVVPTMLLAPAALMLGALTRAKTWLHVQDFELHAAFGLKLLGGPLTYLFGGWAEKTLVRSFDRVSTISEPMHARLLAAGVPKDRASILPNWVDTDEIHPLERPGAGRSRLGWPMDRPVALYSGYMGRKHGLDIVVDAARRLNGVSDVLFVLCGDGIERVRLEESCRDLPNVQFLPLQPREHLNALLNAADIHLLPQDAGAADFVMPSKLTGMLASGRPVVTTAAPGTELARVVGQTGLVVPPGDAAAFAAAIRQLAERPEERAQWGRRARTYALQHLSRGAILDPFVATIRGSLAGYPLAP